MCLCVQILTSWVQFSSTDCGGEAPERVPLTKSDVVVRLGLCCLLAQASRWVGRVCAKSTYSCLNAAQLNHSPSQLLCILVILVTAMSVMSKVGVAGVCSRAIPTLSHFSLTLSLCFAGCQERSAFPLLISAGRNSCWALPLCTSYHSLSASQWLRTQIISTPSFSRLFIVNKGFDIN